MIVSLSLLSNESFLSVCRHSSKTLWVPCWCKCCTPLSQTWAAILSRRHGEEEREGGLLTRGRRRVAVLRRTWTRSRTDRDLDHSGGGGGERWKPPLQARRRHDSRWRCGSRGASGSPRTARRMSQRRANGTPRQQISRTPRP